LEAESGYSRFLHGEAVGFGMRAATYLASLVGMLNERDKQSILDAIHLYGPVPSTRGIRTDALVARLARDKKTVQGAVHFVLPEAIGQVRVVTGVDEELVAEATRTALRELEG
jgi:3-dehydroquinate synthase